MKDQDFVKNKIRLAKDFESQGKKLHALQIYQSLTFENKVAEVYFPLAEIYEQMGFVEKGVELLIDFLNNNSATDENKIYCSQYLIRNSKWSQSVKILSELNSDEHSVVLFLLGYSNFMMNNLQSAEVNFKLFLSKNKSNELKQNTYFYLAKIMVVIKQFENAIEYLKQAEFFYSNYWELYYLFAKAYNGLNMPNHAMQFIQKSIKLNPDSSEVLEEMGKTYYKLRDFKKAREFFLRYIDTVDFISAEIYTYLAQAYVNEQMFDEADIYLDLALKIDPNYEPALQERNKINSR